MISSWLRRNIYLYWEKNILVGRHLINREKTAKNMRFLCTREIDAHIQLWNFVKKICPKEWENQHDWRPNRYVDTFPIQPNQIQRDISGWKFNCVTNKIHGDDENEIAGPVNQCWWSKFWQCSWLGRNGLIKSGEVGITMSLFSAPPNSQEISIKVLILCWDFLLLLPLHRFLSLELDEI